MTNTCNELDPSRPPFSTFSARSMSSCPKQLLAWAGAFFASLSKIFKSPRALSWQTRCHRAHVCIYMRGKTNCMSSLWVPHFLRESSSLLVDLSRFKPIFSKRYPNLIKTDIATPILKQARWRVLRSTWILYVMRLYDLMLYDARSFEIISYYITLYHI